MFGDRPSLDHSTVGTSSSKGIVQGRRTASPTKALILCGSAKTFPGGRDLKKKKKKLLSVTYCHFFNGQSANASFGVSQPFIILYVQLRAHTHTHTHFCFNFLYVKINRSVKHSLLKSIILRRQSTRVRFYPTNNTNKQANKQTNK